MKAIILAAGYGNRMRPLTDGRHKTLLEVGGRTIISRILDGLIDNGIREVVIVTGYRSQELSEYVRGKYPDLRFSFVHNEKYRETNNIYSVALAFEQISIDQDILLIESDLIYQPAVIRRAINSPYPNVALVDRYRSGMDGTVVTVDRGVVTSVIPPHLQPANFDFSDKFKTLNIYKFSRQFCETAFKKLLVYYSTVFDKNCYYELILGMLIYMQQDVIHAELVEGEQWAEVDDPNDLTVADFVFHADRKKILDQSFGGFWNYDLTDFCFIRNMYFPTPSMISELRNELPHLMYNYGSRQELLDRKMAWFLLCNERRVIALNGVSQVFPILQALYAGKRALIPEPTFGEYPRIFPEASRYSDRIGTSPAQIEKAGADCEVIVIVNPNNPTGSLTPTHWIHRYAAANPSRTVIVDESFIEFSAQPSIVPLLEREPLANVLVIKSLSKSLGVPGIRLGYVYGADEGLLGRIRAAVPIWNMNSLAEFFLEIILKHRTALQRSFADTAADRVQFAASLESRPWVEKVFPSGANFLLVKLSGAGSAARLSAALLERHSIFVKDISSKFDDGGSYLRLAVRLPAEHARLLSCADQILQE